MSASVGDGPTGISNQHRLFITKHDRHGRHVKDEMTVDLFIPGIPVIIYSDKAVQVNRLHQQSKQARTQRKSATRQRRSTVTRVLCGRRRSSRRPVRRSVSGH
jgi:hypothetical protein